MLRKLIIQILKEVGHEMKMSQVWYTYFFQKQTTSEINNCVYGHYRKLQNIQGQKNRKPQR